MRATIRAHHTSNGYPDKLPLDQVPVEAQILNLCDSFDAMTNKRPRVILKSSAFPLRP